MPLYSFNINKKVFLAVLAFFAALCGFIFLIVPNFWQSFLAQWPTETLTTKIVFFSAWALVLIAYGGFISAALSRKPLIDFYDDRVVHNSVFLHTSRTYRHDRIAGLVFQRVGKNNYTILIHHFPECKETTQKNLKCKSIYAKLLNPPEEVDSFWEDYRKYFSGEDQKT